MCGYNSQNDICKNDKLSCWRAILKSNIVETNKKLGTNLKKNFTYFVLAHEMIFKKSCNIQSGEIWIFFSAWMARYRLSSFL